MRQALRVFFLSAGIVSAATGASAAPLLQLDIVGGYYDTSTQSVVSSGPIFQLVALFTPKAGETFNLDDLFYVSAAVMPQTAPPGGEYGSFTWDDDAAAMRTVSATGGMEYGVPPIETAFDLDTEEARDAGDLPQHSVYPTYFTEFAFKFDAADLTTTYNSQETPGGLSPSATGGTYYHTFDLNLTGLLAPITGLHFDLYDSILKEECMGPRATRVCSADLDIDHFAPFSHAQSGPGLPVVPEPATLVLLATGLVISARSIRRRPSSTK